MSDELNAVVFALAFHRLLHLVLRHVHELHDKVTLVQQEVMLHRPVHIYTYCKTLNFRVHLIFVNFANRVKLQN